MLLDCVQDCRYYHKGTMHPFHAGTQYQLKDDLGSVLLSQMPAFFHLVPENKEVPISNAIGLDQFTNAQLTTMCEWLNLVVPSRATKHMLIAILLGNPQPAAPDEIKVAEPDGQSETNLDESQKAEEEESKTVDLTGVSISDEDESDASNEGDEQGGNSL